MKKPYYNEIERLAIKENDSLFASIAILEMALNSVKKEFAKLFTPILDYISNKMNKVL